MGACTAQPQTSCTSTTSNTCTIDITDDTLQDIFCDNNYENCIINSNQCDEKKNECDIGYTIECPLSGNSCTVNCNSVC